MKITADADLAEIDRILEKRTKDFVIISQIYVSYEELQTIISVIKEEINVRDEHRNILFIWTMYPLTCLVLTVHYAIHMYDGNYWGNLRKAINIEKDNTWKVLFYRELKNRGLIDFNEKESQKYSTNVLGHAGVPKHNVAAFINNVIIPAVEYGLSAPEVVEQFRYEENNEIKMYHLYKGVKDFVRLGKEVSQGFIERCIHVWREHKKPFVENYVGYLPMHILVEFDNFTITNSYTHTSKYYKISRPKLKYDPSNQQIYISLPIQKLKLNDVSQIRWEISNKSVNNKQTVSTYSVKYPNRLEEEFIVEDYQKRYLVKSNSIYKVSLIFDGKEKQSWTYRTNQWMLFNPELFELETDLTKKYERILLISKRKYLDQIDNGKSEVIINPLFGNWQGYYEIEINAIKYVKYKLDNEILSLTPDLFQPYLEGEKWSNLRHNYPIYSTVPSIVFPKEYESIYNIDRLRINILNTWTSDSNSLLINEISQVFENEVGDTVVPLHQILTAPLFGIYEISVIGSLGSDVKFNLIYLDSKDFSLQIMEESNTYTVNLHSSEYLQMNIVTPTELIPTLRKGMYEENNISIKLDRRYSQLIIQLRNMRTEESFTFKCFTKLFRIYSACNENVFEQGGLTNKEEFDLLNSKVILDLENPELLNFGKKLHVQLSEKTSKGEKAIFNQYLATGRKHLISYRYFEGLTIDADRRIILFKIHGVMEKEEPLILIDTTWKLWDIVAKKAGESVQLTWKQNYMPRNARVHVWSLHDPTNTGNVYSRELEHGSQKVTIPLPTNDNGYFLFEWKKEDDNDPFAFFIKETYPKLNGSNVYLYSVDGDQQFVRLAEKVLLLDSSGGEYERTGDELIDLLFAINKWGNEYVEYLLKGYDYCCDFGIQNIDNLLNLYQDTSVDRVYLEIMEKITGFQEWDDESMLTIIEGYVSQNSLEKLTLDTNRFGSFAKDSKSLLMKNKEELNYIYQTMPFEDHIIKGFSIKHTLIDFIRRIITQPEYKHRVTWLINNYYDKLSEIFGKYQVKLQINNRIKSLVSCRKTRAPEVNYSYLPSMMALATVLTRSLANYEFHFLDEERIFIRNIAKELLAIDREWFIHDLSFITLVHKQIREQERLAKERRKLYGHPSFSWKRRD